MASIALIGGLALSGCGTDVAGTSPAAATTQVATTQLSTGTGSTGASTDTTSTTSETISATTAAARAFMDTLSNEQLEALTYDYDEETKSTSWSNFPVTFVDRAGVNLADLTEEQQAAALAVLEGLLSEESYQMAVGIMDGDQYLLDNSSSTEESLG